MGPEKAPAEDDWEDYRRLSLSPGGFGEERAIIWPKLLHAQPETFVPTPDKDDNGSLSHRDERQIRLDTERSFVLYPVDSKMDKDILQSELHDLLVQIFRRRPRLNYFQGYHDIITVLLLTLPPDLRLPCAEQLSLQRVRDSMGTTLEPVLGLLRVMKNLLRVSDPSYAELLEQTSPLPYYALPNLLTLFSHDMPKLALIQHVFDYLLCRPPIFVVYLACVIILSRKKDVQRLQEEGEEGMMHSLLSALPNIVDEVEDPSDDDIKLEEPPEEETTTDASLSDVKQEEVSEDDIKLEDPPGEEITTDLGISDVKQEEVSADDIKLEEPPGEETTTDLGDSDVKLEEVSDVEVRGDLSDASDYAVDPSDHETSGIPEKPPTEASIVTAVETKTEEASLSDSLESSGEKAEPLPELERRRLAKRKPQSLTDILNMSDALYKAHPPTDSAIQLSSIMGPQSVVFTWSPHLTDMPTNDEAECMVERPELIVYPERPLDEDKEKNVAKRRRKRLKTRVDSRTVRMVVGAGFVLGVAVAISVYRAWQSGDHAREWRKIARWIGGVLDILRYYRT